MADNKKLSDDEKRKLIGFYKEKNKKKNKTKKQQHINKNIKTTDLAALELFSGACNGAMLHCMRTKKALVTP